MHQNLGQAEVATGKQQNPVAARGVPGIFLHLSLTPTAATTQAVNF
jgi:hypothetical protein